MSIMRRYNNISYTKIIVFKKEDAEMEVDEEESFSIPKLPNLKCKICKETLATTKDLRNHLRLEHYCVKCDFIAIEVSRLSYHLKSVHGISTVPTSVTSVQKPTEPNEDIETCETILDPSTGQFIDSSQAFKIMAELDKEDESVGTGLVGAPACGDVMRLQIQVSDDGIIEDAKFKTYGCGSAIASSSLLTEWVKGRHIDEAEQIKNTELAQELSLPPVKIHCSVLAEDAIKTAVKDIREKRKK